MGREDWVRELDEEGCEFMIPVINKRETGINLRKIMDKRGITVKEVQQYLGLGSVQSVYHWLNGISMPTVDNLYALSALFKLPVDAMLCGNRAEIEGNVVPEVRESYCRRMYIYYTRLSEMCGA